MKIHIYQYGLLQDVMLDSLSPTLQVFYGANEAGKSTVMSFVRGVLFGFSEKSKYSTETDGTFGGCVTLSLPEKGIFTIERIGKKGKGKVSVYLENGQTVGEEFLEAMLQGLTPAMFDAIFCFNLEGLQGLEKIEASHLNDYLFNAGMTGSFSIQALEKKLERKQQGLFKPGGRKPQLNEELAELQQLEKDINKWKEQTESYRNLVETSEKKEQRLNEITTMKTKIHEVIRSLERRKHIAPFVKEEQKWLEQLNHLPTYEPFPEDGLARFEQWKTKKIEIEAELVEIKERQQQTVEKLKNLYVRTGWLDYQDEVWCEREEERLFENKQQEIIKLKQEIHYEEAELAAMLEKLGTPWSEAGIAEADTGLAAKEALQNNVQTLERLNQRQQIIKEETLRKQYALQESNAKIKELSGRRLSDKEKAECHDVIKKYTEVEKRRKKREQLEERLKHIDDRIDTTNNSKPLLLSPSFIAMILIGIALSVWMFTTGEFIFGVITVLMTASMAGLFARSQQQPSMYRKELITERDGLDNALRQLKGELSIEAIQKNAGNVEKAKINLAEDERLQQVEHIQEQQRNEDEKAYNQIVKNQEQLQKDIEQVHENLEIWSEKHHFEISVHSLQLPETFECVEEAKKSTRQLHRAKERLEQLNAELQEREQRLKQLSKIFQIRYENSGLAIRQMTTLIEEQQKHQHERLQYEKEVKNAEQQISSLQKKSNHYDTQCRKLMDQAETDNEEVYRYKAQAWQESRHILENLAAVRSNIVALVSDESEREQMVQAIRTSEIDEEREINKRTQEIKQLETEERELHHAQAELDTKKKQLEEGGTYVTLLHQYELKKDQFRKKAKRWAMYRTAEHMLNKAKEQYRNERQPKVVDQATHYFSMMTEGRYETLFAPVDEGFVVERADGARFVPQQLSRGTAEQLYLSLRIALAHIYESSSAYPIIMDDILVNFDERRAEKAVQVIREASQHQQLFLFTCHRHLIKYFHENEILEVGRNSMKIEH